MLLAFDYGISILVLSLCFMIFKIVKIHRNVIHLSCIICGPIDGFVWMCCFFHEIDWRYFRFRENNWLFWLQLSSWHQTLTSSPVRRFVTLSSWYRAVFPCLTSRDPKVNCKQAPIDDYQTDSQNRTRKKGTLTIETTSLSWKCDQHSPGRQLNVRLSSVL